MESCVMFPMPWVWVTYIVSSWCVHWWCQIKHLAIWITNWKRLKLHNLCWSDTIARVGLSQGGIRQVPVCAPAYFCSSSESGRGTQQLGRRVGRENNQGGIDLLSSSLEECEVTGLVFVHPTEHCSKCYSSSGHSA